MIKESKKLRNRLRIQKNKLFVGEKKEILEERPEFDTVHEHPHGHLEITNSEAAVRVSDVLENIDSDDDDEFPEISHVFDSPKDTLVNVKIPTKELEDLTNDVAKETDYMHIEVTPKGLHLTPKKRGHSDEMESIDLEKDFDINNDIAFILSPRYFNEAMNFFRMLNIKEVTLIVEDPDKPIRFLHENAHYVIAAMSSK